MLQTRTAGKRNVGGRTRRWARSRGVLLALGIVAGAGLVVRAVHDTGAFELDGNATASTTDDWDRVFGGTSTATATSFNEDSIVGNGPSLAATIFTGGGSKDPIDINSWAWKDDANGPPDKDNLLHSFAARYSLTPTNPADVPNLPPGSPVCFNGTGGTGQPAFNPNLKCEVLYFGSDRYDNSGDATQAFWFFQNEIGLGTNSIGGGTGFTGVHKPGDLLIISDFSNGGTKSTIIVLKWDPVCTATNKPDGGCADSNLRRLAQSTAANCATATAGDAFCGIVNPGPGLTNSPWPFLDKSGNTNFANGEFYEGGVNLSLLGLGGECFASIGSETRSSTSTSAVLKDFVLGGFARCDSGLVTTPKNGSGNAIPAGGLSIGTGSVSARDSAVLTINGVQTWSGTMSFSLCGPADLVSQASCLTGGTVIDASIAVSNLSTQPILSSAAQLTSAGRYCWRGTFTSSTPGVPNATDASATECFTVNPVTPLIPTEASGNVVLGNPVSDAANLSGTASRPGAPVINGPLGSAAAGSITFRLYGPNDATCTGTPVFTSSAVPVAGNGLYNSGSFTPLTVGTYRWIATYTGDSPNTNAAAGVCNAANESVVVSPRQPAISTVATPGPVNLGASISDVATLSGTAAGAGGSITFNAYGPNDATCSTSVFSSTVAVNGSGQYTSGSFTPTAPGTYRWIASYSGDLPNTLGVSGSCNDANEASIVQQLNPTISTAQTFTVKDSATITVAAGAGNLAGSVRFRLYNNASCSTIAPNELLYDSNVLHPTGIAVSGALTRTVESDVTTITVSKPVLSWLVEYTSTNGGHTNVASSCNTERASLTIVNQ